MIPVTPLEDLMIAEIESENTILDSLLSLLLLDGGGGEVEQH